MSIPTQRGTFESQEEEREEEERYEEWLSYQDNGQFDSGDAFQEKLDMFRNEH